MVASLGAVWACTPSPQDEKLWLLNSAANSRTCSTACTASSTTSSTRTTRKHSVLAEGSAVLTPTWGPSSLTTCRCRFRCSPKALYSCGGYSLSAAYAAASSAICCPCLRLVNCNGQRCRRCAPAIDPQQHAGKREPNSRKLPNNACVMCDVSFTLVSWSSEIHQWIVAMPWHHQLQTWLQVLDVTSCNMSVP